MKSVNLQSMAVLRKLPQTFQLCKSSLLVVTAAVAELDSLPNKHVTNALLPIASLLRRLKHA
jgi:hypothetical protein